MIVILLGVAGSGKTTLGQRLAASLGWPFFDADDFHPPANIAKMTRGLPLTDDDRWPWLARLRANIETLMQAGDSGVFTCSALKQIYRDRLKRGGEPIHFVFLKGDYATIESRLKERRHFMRPDMLRSQFAALEEPADALVVDVSQSPEHCLAHIRAGLGI